MLFAAEMARGDLRGARLHALRLPPGAVRHDYLARIDQAQGDDAAAQREYLAAADFNAIQSDVRRIAARDPARAYDLERKLKARLVALTTHPDAVAEATWHLGELATLRSYHDPARRTQWLKVGMRDYRNAVALAPLSDKYLLAAGTQALALKDLASARRFYQRAIDVDPASADGYAGLGEVALLAGNRAQARAFAARSRSLDPDAKLLKKLEARLR